MKPEHFVYINLGLLVAVIILLVFLLLRQYPVQQTKPDYSEILIKLDSLQKFRDTVKETKTIIKEKFIEARNENQNTNDIDSLISIFIEQYYFAADTNSNKSRFIQRTNW